MAIGYMIFFQVGRDFSIPIKTWSQEQEHILALSSQAVKQQLWPGKPFHLHLPIQKEAEPWSGQHTFPNSDCATGNA